MSWGHRKFLNNNLIFNIMKNITLVFVSFLVFNFSSCKQDKKDEVKTDSMKEVMAIHDEVMPKMGSVGKLVSELSAKKDSTETGAGYDLAKKELQAANKSMMDWMHDFGDRFTTDEIMNGKELSPEKQLWLAEEKAKIEAIRAQYNSSIKNAEKLLAE